MYHHRMPFDTSSRTTPSTATATTAPSLADHDRENQRLARACIAARLAAWTNASTGDLRAAASYLGLDLKGLRRPAKARAIAAADRSRDDDALRTLSLDGEVRRYLDVMVRRNMGLVWRVAIRTSAALQRSPQRDEYRAAHLSRDDLAQEGALGLMRGCRLFDPERGWRLSTYVVWWIRHQVQRAISDKASLVRVPVHIGEKVARAAMREQGLRPTGALTPEAAGKEARAVASLPRVASGDRLIGGGGIKDSFTLFDHVTDDDPSAEDNLVSGSSAATLHSLVSALPDDRERLIIRRRFLHDADLPGVTLAEIGDDLGVSRERVRQIQGDALKSLRRSMMRMEVRP